MSWARWGVGIAAAAAVVAVLAGPTSAAAPGNDDLANRTVLNAPTAVNGDTTDATIEPGEPEHAGDEGGASVWYEWTAPSAGNYVISTAGSSFDTLLAVYTAGRNPISYANLAAVAYNDDATDSLGTSRVCFNAPMNAKFEIAVDGYGGDSGAFHLQIDQKASDVTDPCPSVGLDVAPTAPEVGDSVHASGGAWIDGGHVPVTHQWYRCQAESCDPIDGATGLDYIVTPRDVGTNLRIDEIENHAVSTSDPTDAVTGTPALAVADGRIYWSALNGADFDIFSMLPGDVSSRRVVLDDAQNSLGPVPSPDGTLIAFRRGASGHIALTTADGSTVYDTQLAGAFPTWSPDGSRLAFATGSFVPGGGSNFDGIDVVDIDTGDVSHLLSGAPGTFYDLAWSPDGGTIAFTYKDGGDWDIEAIAADGRGPISPLAASTTLDEHGPSWSPDGSRIAFVRGPAAVEPTGRELIVMNADGSQTALVGDAQHEVRAVSWSPTGTSLLFTEDDNLGTHLLFTAVYDSVHNVISPKTAIPTNVFWPQNPAWSAPATFTLDVSRDGDGAGVVASSSGGIACGSSCSGVFADATSVTLTATPAAGSTFDGWSGACSGTSTTCVISMIGDRDVAATFDAVPPPPPEPPAPPAPPTGGSGGGGGGGSSGIPPDIHVDVTASAATPPAVGSDLIFFVTVSSKNTGGSSDVKLELTLPAGWTYDHSYADRGPGCAGTPPKLTCDVAFINPGSSTHVQLFGKVAQAGDLALTATATSQQEPELDPKDNTVTLALTTPTAPPPTTPSPTPVPKPAAPTIAGTPRVGSTLHATAPAGAHLQWQLCTASRCTPIKGATKPALKLLTAYAGKSVRVVATVNGRTVYSRRLAVRGRAVSR